jgi:hypothetical protein
LKKEIQNLKDSYLKMVGKITAAALSLRKKGRSKEEILTSLSDPRFKETILSDQQFKGSLNNLSLLYGDTLKSMSKFGDINSNTILALTKLNKSTFIDKLEGDIVNSVKSNLANGIVSGLSKDQIIDSIQSGFRPDQIDSLVTTAFATYTASINSIMADSLPDNTAYIYRGPIDSKTRPLCLALMSRGEVTKKEIEKEFPNVFVERGGYNCRHQWAVSVKNNVMHSPSKARSEAKQRGVSIA